MGKKTVLRLAAYALALMACAQGFAAEKSGLSWMLPEGITTFADKVDTLFYTLMYTTIIVFGIVVAVLLFFCIRYRRTPGAKAYYTHGDSWKATALTGTLAMMVFLGIDMNTVRLSKAASADMENHPDYKDAVHVQLLAKQFAWVFRYPGPDGKFGRVDSKAATDDNWFGVDEKDPAEADDIQVEGYLVIPVGKPVMIEIRSKDVIHSFFIAAIRFKQDAVPGMKTSIWFSPRRTGDFEIVCAELCGAQHSQMGGKMRVMNTQEECDNFLKKFAR